jgi:hypothetical protein
MHKTCRHCGSEKIIPDLEIQVGVATARGAAGGRADVVIEGAPHAWVFKDVTCGELRGSICGDCGHAELQAHNFRALYEKYEKSRRSHG